MKSGGLLFALYHRKRVAITMAGMSRVRIIFAAMLLGWLLTPCRAADWPDWRGRNRDGISPDVPTTLPAKARFIWQRRLAGQGLSGVSATTRHVIVADKSADSSRDIWRCLNPADGSEMWKVEYLAVGQMDYSNTPRAAPVIAGDRAFLLGAFGDLHCVELAGGAIAWRKNIITEFAAKRPTWGMCSTPLLVGDRLIVNPGAKDAGVVALSAKDGGVIWTGPGGIAAYASLIHGTFGGVQQVVGYDATTLAGWDLATGKRLWRLRPGNDRDFNVPTPIDLGGRLLVATENNGARIHDFRPGGIINPKLAARFDRANSNTVTPVVLDGLMFTTSEQALYCLDVKDNLKLRWAGEDRAYADHTSLIAGNGHVLILTFRGDLILIKADRAGYQVVSRLRLFQDDETELWAHPALVGDRLYVRDQHAISCVDLR